MTKIIIETDGSHYWIAVNEGDYWYLGDDIDDLINSDITFRKLALSNGAEMSWNDQIDQYEFIFEDEHSAIRTKNELSEYL